MKSFFVDIVAKDEQVYSGEADYILLPGWDGEIGVFASHTPIISMLRPGVCKLRFENQELVWAMSEGFVSISGDKVTAAVTFAYSPDEIDDELAEQELESARKALSEKTSVSMTDEDYLKEQRALVCLKVVKEYLDE